MIALDMNSVNHQSPGNIYRLSNQAGQAIHDGQTTNKNVAWPLQRNHFYDGDDNCQVCKKGEDAQRYVDDTQRYVTHEGGRIVF